MNVNKLHKESHDIEDSEDIFLSNKASKFVKTKIEDVYAMKRRSSLREEPWSDTENNRNLYAILPPMEKFMDVDKKDSLHYIWDGFQRGDLIVVRITSIRENGFKALLVALDGGKSKHISHSIHAWCPVNEIPKKTNHEDVLLQFSDGDLIRCVIIEVKSELIISLRSQSSSKYKVSLGQIDDEELPQAYRRSLTSSETYENILTKCVGFVNPSSIEYLLKRLQVPDGPQMSLMNGLRHIDIMKREYAESIRKQQSKKVADANVKKGIKHFKNMEYELALQNFNYALDMDTDNVDGLVARGALYANRTCFSKAIRDFEAALKFEPSHKNAKKYLTEVLVERAKQIESQIEDVQQIKEVKRCYQKALTIDPNCEEAKTALGQIEKDQRKSAESDSTSTASGSDNSQNEYASTAKKLKGILENDVNIRKRSISEGKRSRKRRKSERSSTSSSSSSSSSTSSTSSSSTSSSSSSDQDTSPQKTQRSKQTSQSSRKPRKSEDDSECNKSRDSTKTDDNSKGRRTSSSSSASANSRKSMPTSIPKSSDIPCSSKHGKSYVQGPARAVIRSSEERIHEKNSNRTSRRRSSDIKSITNDNLKDILHEISMFETTSKTKRG